MTMDPTTKMIIISGSVVGVIVLVLVLWLCYCCGLCSCICRLFSKLTKKRVKQQQFDIVDYDPKYPFFKPRNFKGKGAIIIQKQMTVVFWNEGNIFNNFFIKDSRNSNG